MPLGQREGYDHHKCSINMVESKEYKSFWLAKYYLFKFREKPNWFAVDIVN